MNTPLVAVVLVSCYPVAAVHGQQRQGDTQYPSAIYLAPDRGRCLLASCRFAGLVSAGKYDQPHSIL